MDTLSEKGLRELHEDIFGRMRDADWLVGYRLFEGSGYDLTWTARGLLAATNLQNWYRALSLGEADCRPWVACLLACETGIDPLSNPAIDEALRPYVDSGLALQASFCRERGCRVRWSPEGLVFQEKLRELLTELLLPINEDHCLVLFLIAEGWGADRD